MYRVQNPSGSRPSNTRENPDKSYQVFWNVKDFDAKGDGSTLAIKYVTLKRLNLFEFFAHTRYSKAMSYSGRHGSGETSRNPSTYVSHLLWLWLFTQPDLFCKVSLGDVSCKFPHSRPCCYRYAIPLPTYFKLI